MIPSDERVMIRGWLSLTFLAVLIACGQIEDPQRLLVIGSGYAGPLSRTDEHLAAPTDEARLEAVRGLLRLQSNKFGISLPPIKAKDATYLDHILVRTLRFSANTVTILATPYQLADRKAPEADYWSMEELTFEISGKLLSRQPYRE